MLLIIGIEKDSGNHLNLYVKIMRLLLNHGLTGGEIFINTPPRVTTQKWKQLNQTYSWGRSHGDALAGPFKYCMTLVFNKILDDRMRFKVPYSKSYIDFEIVMEEELMKQRQNGRFTEIDLIESDFTGYFLNYFFQSKAYQKVLPIYIGGGLKKKFLNGINSGIKYYTKTDFTIDDVLDEVYEKFYTIPPDEIRRIVIHGLRRMNSAIHYGCYITLASTNFDLYAYIGTIPSNPEKRWKEYCVRRERKLRKIDAWGKKPYEGYYYIGLAQSMYEQWIELNKKTRTMVQFENVMCKKIQEELYGRNTFVHVFRFKVPKFKGYVFWKDKMKDDSVEYLGYAQDRKFVKVDKTWKQIIKEHEKGSS